MNGHQGTCASGDDNNLNDSAESNPVTAITKKDYTPLQFWNYVDDYLETVETVFFADIPDPVDRGRKIAS